MVARNKNKRDICGNCNQIIYLDAWYSPARWMHLRTNDVMCNAEPIAIPKSELRPILVKKEQ